MDCTVPESLENYGRATLIALTALLWLAIVTPAGWAGIPWNLNQLSQPPRVYPAPDFQENGVRALFFEGVPWRGKPTRVFAWYGLPVTTGKDKVPAVILVHGGGGTAFVDWVKLWNSRGYAALAIDTCGSVPLPAPNNTWQRHEFGGPPCWDASFDQIDWAKKDQWTYQAVAAIVLANSLMRSFPEVDPERIGITGISWGGYLTAIAASIDPRFRFAAPVYGCGFLGHDSFWLQEFKKMGVARARKWLNIWDPSVYLGRAKMPFLWVDGTNDMFYPLDSLQKSYSLPRGPRTLSIRICMPHNHEAGERAQEIQAFADHYLKSGVPVASVRSQGRKGRSVYVTYEAQVSIVRAELTYTMDNGPWKDRRWDAVPAEVNPGERLVRAILPQDVTVFYFNLTDDRGLLVSSDPTSAGTLSAVGAGFERRATLSTVP